MMVEVAKIMFDLKSQAVLDAYRVRALVPERAPRTEREFEEFVRSHAASVYHPVGTCRMGRSSDAQAVVDSELRVHGIAGLRVVDASVMPQLPGGNTNAPTVMLAERASDFMLGHA